jgi:DNA primase large subunit
MKAIHARYPFLRDAREAVQAAGVDLAELVVDGGPVVERAVGRVESALTDYEIGERHDDTDVEILSYPVARILVSLVDEHILINRYARAEAATAFDRFTEEFEEADEDYNAVSTERLLTLDDLLGEFDITDAIREDGGRFRVDVATYLRLAADVWGDEWRLVNRPLWDGVVPVERDELYVLLRQAVQERVESELPLSVPDAIAGHLEEEVAHLQEVLAELELTREIDTVVPDLFPPCMKSLLDQIQKGAHLAHHSRFAITAFLTSIGMTTDDIVELYRVNSSFGEEMTRYQTDHIRGKTSPTEYSPPSCATMQSYGDCVNMDDLCERISHPMAYYEKKLDDADEEELEDWREKTADAEG